MPPDVRRLLPLFALLAAGCHRFPDDTPVAAYRSLVLAAQRGEGERVLALLAAPSRAALEQRTRALAEASGGALSAEPADAVLGRARVAAPTDVTLKDAGPDTALLAVTTGGTVAEVRLVREEGHWRVVVPALEPPRNG